jgi:hypothetical protein
MKIISSWYGNYITAAMRGDILSDQYLPTRSTEIIRQIIFFNSMELNTHNANRDDAIYVLRIYNYGNIDHKYSVIGYNGKRDSMLSPTGFGLFNSSTEAERKFGEQLRYREGRNYSRSSTLTNNADAMASNNIDHYIPYALNRPTMPSSQTPQPQNQPVNNPKPTYTPPSYTIEDAVNLIQADAEPEKTVEAINYILNVWKSGSDREIDEFVRAVMDSKYYPLIFTKPYERFDHISLLKKHRNMIDQHYGKTNKIEEDDAPFNPDNAENLLASSNKFTKLSNSNWYLKSKI